MYSTEDQWAIPVINPGALGKRLNQKPELLAVIEGLHRSSRGTTSHDTPPFKYSHYQNENGVPDCFWIIATESEYAHKGITEWTY